MELKGGHCCGINVPDAAAKRGQGRLVDLIKYLVPSAVLFAIPKCPLCIVAYIVAFSGIGISIPTASGVRLILIAISVTSLILLSGRKIHAFLQTSLLRR
jgi:hypothetical protein